MWKVDANLMRREVRVSDVRMYHALGNTCYSCEILDVLSWRVKQCDMSKSLQCKRCQVFLVSSFSLNSTFFRALEAPAGHPLTR